MNASSVVRMEAASELGYVEFDLQTRRRLAPVRARERSFLLDAHEDFVQVDHSTDIKLEMISFPSR